MTPVQPAFNQTVTELLPSRKPSDQKAERPEDFGRELKGANKRLDSPKPVEDKPRRTEKADKPVQPEETTQPNAAEDAQPIDKPVKDTQAQTDQAEPVDKPTADQTPAETEATTQDPSQQQQATGEAVAEVVTNQQLVEQVQVSVNTQTVAQTEQTAQTQTVQNTQSATEQAQVTAATQTTGGGSTTEQATNKAVQTVVQPQQVKQTQTQQTESATQAEPSAAAQRIALVAEARQQDTGTSTSDDSNKQQQGTLKTDTGAQTALNTSSINTNTASTTTAAPAISPGTQTVISADNSAQASGPSVVTGNTNQTQGTDNTQINTARIARGMQNAIQQKGGAVTLRLTPPEMGTVRIHLQIQSGTVNAQFHAETESTRTMLHQQMSQLRTALEQQGLNVERLGVQTMHQSSHSSAQQEYQKNERDGQPNDGRSRGGFNHQGNRQEQRQAGGEQQSAFEQQLTTAA